jgi:hypothetical protein
MRGTIVVASALLRHEFVAGAARGSYRAFLRLRLASAIMVAAIAVIVALPDPFPLWMKIDQACSGLILAAVVAIVNGRALAVRQVSRGRPGPRPASRVLGRA